MDGHCLLHMYEMCMMNRESMFQSLKAELAEKHKQLLPIGDYIIFLRETKKYIPFTPEKFRATAWDPISTINCTVM